MTDPIFSDDRITVRPGLVTLDGVAYPTRNLSALRIVAAPAAAGCGRAGGVLAGLALAVVGVGVLAGNAGPAAPAIGGVLLLAGLAAMAMAVAPPKQQQKRYRLTFRSGADNPYFESRDIERLQAVKQAIEESISAG